MMIHRIKFMYDAKGNMMFQITDCSHDNIGLYLMKYIDPVLYRTGSKFFSPWTGSN